MLLRKITLNNFRQFYGTQEVDISSDPERNVTLIHAENGVGKTTILNSILWCFYEDTTEKFEQKDKIANFEAVSEGNHSFGVEVLFEHKGSEYQVIRKHNQKTGEKEFKAFVVGKGNYTDLGNPTVFVDSVIPREMARYFFFDGEYAETFSSQNNKKEVKEALENMLGCKTALQAIEDLTSIRADIEKDISGSAKNNSLTVALQGKIDELETDKLRHEQELKTLESNLESEHAARKEIQEKLRGTEGISEIQKRREEYESKLEKMKANKNKHEASISTWLNEYGISLLSKNIEKTVSNIFEIAKTSGRVPSNVAENFVKGIIHSQVCICDRPFTHGSKEETAIMKLLEDAGNALVMDRMIKASNLMSNLTDRRKKALSELKKIKENIKACNDGIDEFEGKIHECSEQIKQRGGEVKEIAEREHALERKIESIGKIENKMGELKIKIDMISQEIKKNKDNREKFLASDNKVTELNKRKNLLDAAITAIEAELEKYKIDSRAAIGNEINEILKSTARRHYYACIDEKFNLEMFFTENNTPVPKSSGENQLLSLAFIASLIKFSANRMNDESELLKPGTHAPLVLDSPFGQISDTYRTSAANFLPKLAKQIILLVSKSQGDSDVMKVIGSRIGSELVLISENRGSNEGKPVDAIQVGNKTIESSRYGCEKNLTKIINVNN